jgi:hypothetical protein|uniref:Uncharacterized protein n=1 Tax=viral metagenome TaxID=1070528 RepID=A0A6C0IL62_9ZZZZ
MSSLSYVDEMPTQMAYEKPCVYFTTSNLVTLDDAHLDNADFSLRVTTLPRDYSDEEGATKLFEEVLRIGKVSKMVIVEKSFYNRRLSTNTTTHSATVDFEYWNNNTANVQLRDYIVNNHNAKISIVANDQLYWENGEPMSHLSISKGNSSPHSLLGVSKQNDENNQLDLSDNDWKSLYIPFISSNMLIGTPEGSTSRFIPMVKDYLETTLSLGKVSRIDFVDRELENGSRGKALFIHFEHWYENDYTKSFRNMLDTTGHYRFKGEYNNGVFCKLYAMNEDGDKVPGYIVFKINHKPIPEVENEVNVHQLSAANVFLTEELEKMTKTVEELQKELEKYKNMTTSA